MAIDDHAPGGAGEGVANMVSELNLRTGGNHRQFAYRRAKCALSYGGSK